MKTITINVTQRDIDKGLKKCPERCPIAISVRRRVRRDADVTVGNYAVVVSRDGHASSFYNMPREARDFVVRFDSKRWRTKPMKFQLEMDERFLT